MQSGSEYPAKRLSEWEEALAKAQSASSELKWSYLCPEQTASTMEVARQSLSVLTAGSPCLVLAKEQSEGRGQRGKKWHSPSEGFFATYIFSIDRKIQKISSFSLVAAYTVAQALNGEGAEVGLKWPNDLLNFHGEKLGGILIEVIHRDDTTFVLVGVGINLVEKPANIEGACALAELINEKLSAVDVANVLSQPLLNAWHLFIEEGFLPFQDRWNELALYLNQELEVDTGGEVISGIYEGVNPEGFMRLRETDEVRLVASGHIRKLPASSLPE